MVQYPEFKSCKVQDSVAEVQLCAFFRLQLGQTSGPRVRAQTWQEHGPTVEALASQVQTLHVFGRLWAIEGFVLSLQVQSCPVSQDEG